MLRRKFTSGLFYAGASWAWVASPWAEAADFTESDAALGIRAALARGAEAAVSVLGREGGFLNNPKVRIPLPGVLQDAGRMLKLTGQQAKVDELVNGMNHAAELAVPQAKILLTNAVKAISVEDARRIVTGGDNAVTDFFVGKTRSPLGVQFLPVVTRVTERLSLSAKYDAVAGKAASFGLVKKEDANVAGYVTGKALESLYLMIGEEERKIRRDPVGTGSAILKKVFGG